MPVSASELNESERRIRTIFEAPSYPFMTTCHYLYLKPPDDDSEDDDDGDDDDDYGDDDDYSDDDDDQITEDNTDDEMESLRRKLPWIEAHATIWRNQGGWYTAVGGDQLRQCIILARHTDTTNDENDTYTVEMLNLSKVNEIPTEEKHYVKGVPRSAIQFMESSSTSHQQNEHAFRHEIGIPSDDIWPRSWRDFSTS